MDLNQFSNKFFHLSQNAHLAMLKRRQSCDKANKMGISNKMGIASKYMVCHE